MQVCAVQTEKAAAEKRFYLSVLAWRLSYRQSAAAPTSAGCLFPATADAQQSLSCTGALLVCKRKLVNQESPPPRFDSILDTNRTAYRRGQERVRLTQQQQGLDRAPRAAGSSPW